MLWMFFDFLGTIAFAISGTLVGMQRRFDLFGITVLAIVTAIGGGMIRDTLMGNTPPIALQNPTYIILSILTVAILFLFSGKLRHSTRHNKWLMRLYYLADAIGLASFTITGAIVGLESNPDSPFLLPIALGLLTACGGGVIRDICAMRVPIVFKTEIYASASLVGGFIFCLLYPYLYLGLSVPIAFFIILGLRVLAINYRWNLPRSRYR